MLSILINLLTSLVPYIILYYFLTQIISRLNAPLKSIKNENFSHELEQGPFDEEDQTYNLPQPSDPLVTDDIQPGTEELDKIYDQSRIGLDAKIVDPDVKAVALSEKEQRDYEPTPSNNVEEEFTHKLLHGPFNTNVEVTTSTPNDLKEEFRPKLTHGPFNTNVEVTTSAPNDLKEEFSPKLAHGPYVSLETTTYAPLTE